MGSASATPRVHPGVPDLQKRLWASQHQARSRRQIHWGNRAGGFPCPEPHWGTAGVFHSPLFGNILAGKRGVGRAAVGDALGCCQEGCKPTEQPGFPGYTLSCSYLQLPGVWSSLSRSAASAEPQPGLFLADLFIWVLHCSRPRLSFCCTCARVHNPGSFRHMGGVSFYPSLPRELITV